MSEEKPELRPLDKIKRDYEAATDGLWEILEGSCLIQIDSGGTTIAETDCDHLEDRACVLLDFNFITHARIDVPALVAEVERLRETVRIANDCVGRVEEENARLRGRVEELADDLRRAGNSYDQIATAYNDALGAINGWKTENARLRGEPKRLAKEDMERMGFTQEGNHR